MSEALYPETGALRFWSAREIEHRELAIKLIVANVQDSLVNMNRAWQFHRMEGPCLTPMPYISPAYHSNDLWMTNGMVAEKGVVLRAETTASSYQYAAHLLNMRKKFYALPMCVWQVGKSFRREANDGASPAKLRYYEFWQLELQCIYSEGTKADYKTAVMDRLLPCIEWLTRTHEGQIVLSDRLPDYSEHTADIEVQNLNGEWREMASISTRNDFSEGTKVLEVAVGLDRIVEIHGSTA